MRYAIVSDIHSNLEALEAVINDLSCERIDKYLCVGDIVGYGANPVECVRRIKELNAVIVCGNHDWACAGKLELSWFNHYAKEALLWTRSALGFDDLNFLRSLRLVEQIDLFTIAHGTLNRPERFEYMLDIAEAFQSQKICKTQVCVVGHTHIPFIVEFKGADINVVAEDTVKISAGCKYVINAGSVGQPRDGDCRACYCVYDSDTSEFRIKRIDYDIEKTKDKIIKAGLPRLLADRLSVGR